jgi:hypothetical protein
MKYAGGATLTKEGAQRFNKVIKALRDADDESWGLKNVSTKYGATWSTDYNGNRWVLVERTWKHHGDGMGSTQYFQLAFPMKGNAKDTWGFSKMWKDWDGHTVHIRPRPPSFYDNDGKYLGEGLVFGKKKGTPQDQSKRWASMLHNARPGVSQPKKGKGTKKAYGGADPKKPGSGITVRLKVAGGTTKSPLYVGKDSKGRSKYEIEPPPGETAEGVAKAFSKATLQGQKVLGGTVYAIRFAVPGKGEYNYWTQGAS